jgi:hypothetical protein
LIWHADTNLRLQLALQILHNEGIQPPDILIDFAAAQGTESYARYGQRLGIKRSLNPEKASIRKKARTGPNPREEN